MSKIIAIASAKGGVGKTTTAVNLGAALAGFGRPTILVDGNLATPNVGIHLGSPIAPASVHDALLGRKSIRECLFLHESGLRVVPASISLDDFKNAEKAGLVNAIKELDGTCEIIIVDSASGIGDDAFSALEAADEAIVVSTPDLPSVTDAIKTVHLAEEKGVTVVGVVLNRVRGDKLEMSQQEVEAMVERPVIASIPEDFSIRHALKNNHPVVFSHPESSSAVAYKGLAAIIVGQKYELISKKRS